MQLKQKIEESFELVKSINAEDITVYFNYPVSNNLLQEAVKLFPYFPKALQSIYEQCDGFNCSWYFENDTMVISPKINFSPINFLLGGTSNQWNDNAFEDILWFEDTDEPEYIEKVKKLKVLDHNSAQNIFTLIDLNQPNTPLFVWQSGKLYPLNIKIEQYLDALCFTRGITYWQFLYTDVSNDNLKNQALNSLNLLGFDLIDFN